MQELLFLYFTQANTSPSDDRDHIASNDCPSFPQEARLHRLSESDRDETRKSVNDYKDKPLAEHLCSVGVATGAYCETHHELQTLCDTVTDVGAFTIMTLRRSHERSPS